MTRDERNKIRREAFEAGRRSREKDIERAYSRAVGVMVDALHRRAAHEQTRFEEHRREDPGGSVDQPHPGGYAAMTLFELAAVFDRSEGVVRLLAASLVSPASPEGIAAFVHANENPDGCSERCAQCLARLGGDRLFYQK